MKLSLLFIGFVVLLIGCSSGPGEHDTLAQCLTEKGAVMYGTEWCPHCKEQKGKFGSSFQYIHYVDCDKQRAACVAAGVDGYPTWVVNGENHPGVQPLYRLASLAECQDSDTSEA